MESKNNLGPRTLSKSYKGQDIEVRVYYQVATDNYRVAAYVGGKRIEGEWTTESQPKALEWGQIACAQHIERQIVADS